MRNIRAATLEHINIEELTAIWNRCWRGYYYDMTYTPEHMRIWLHLGQVALQHSVAIFVDDQVAGFALLAIDGAEGWIAGTCIDPDYRRKGLFAPLMRTQLDLATRVGLKRVYLEVLEQNHARKVYQSVGFTRLRQLNIYRMKAESLAQMGLDQINQRELWHAFQPVPFEAYIEFRHRAFFNPSWQRRENYLRRYNYALALTNAEGTAGILFAGEKTDAPLLDTWSATADGAEAVITALLQRSGGVLSLTNQPEDWIVAYLNGLGVDPSAKQLEMCVELA